MTNCGGVFSVKQNYHFINITTNAVSKIWRLSNDITALKQITSHLGQDLTVWYISQYLTCYVLQFEGNLHRKTLCIVLHSLLTAKQNKITKLTEAMKQAQETTQHFNVVTNSKSETFWEVIWSSNVHLTTRSNLVLIHVKTETSQVQ